MKTSIVTLLLASFFCQCLPAQCPMADITLSTQGEIDSFPINYPGCSNMPSGLYISGFGINNLGGLSEITSIGGGLSITSNETLTSLNGLGNISSIGGGLGINSNETLISLNGLGNLSSIDGGLWITSNETLTSLNGLGNLSSIGDILWIAGNNNLINLTGLGNLTSIGNAFVVADNDNLTSLTGLNNLDSLGTLFISGNDNLTSLTGLENLIFIGGDIWIGSGILGPCPGNKNLVSLTGLDYLISIGGSLYVCNNDSLTSLAGLEKLTSIGGDLWIGYNNALTSLSGLCHLTSIGGSLEIHSNSALSTCAIEGICNYLNNHSDTITILANNAQGCNSLVEVETACLTPVISSPTASFDLTVNWQTVEFNNLSQNADTYLWDFGDGQTDTLPNPVHTFLNDGTYIVTLTVANPCGSSTTTQTVIIATPPVAGFTASPTSGCFPLTVQFTNTSSANTLYFNWQFFGGAPATSSQQNPTVTYAVPGFYPVTLTVGNGQGIDAATKTDFIHVIGPPAVNFEISSSDGQTVTLTNFSQDADICLWSFGDGDTSTAFNPPPYTYDTPGTYTVTLTCWNDCDYDFQLIVGTENPTWLRTLRLFPNPGDGVFSIEMTDVATSEIEFALYSPDGRLLRREAAQSAGDDALRQTLDYTDLPPALYLLRIRTGENAAMVKVAVQR